VQNYCLKAIWIPLYPKALLWLVSLPSLYAFYTSCLSLQVS